MHHANKKNMVLVKWLPDTPSTVPQPASHYVGVGVAVVSPEMLSCMLSCVSVRAAAVSAVLFALCCLPCQCLSSFFFPLPPF